MSPTIPIIDLSLSRLTVVQFIRTACLTHGFFQITSHQIEPKLQQTLFDYAKRLFALPISEKVLFKRPDNTRSGYEEFKSYSLQAARGKPDLNEGFNVASLFYDDDSFWPVETEENGLIGFRKCCRTYHSAMQGLAKAIAGYIAEGLGLDKTYFDDYFFNPAANCRLIHYFSPDEENEEETSDVKASEERIGAGLHADWGLLTVLLQDDVGGLQVFDPKSSSFIPVPPISNAYVVNVGDLLSRFTNGVYTSPLHRVIAPPSGVHRYSAPFFGHGNLDYVVDVLPLSEEWKAWAQNNGKGKDVDSAVRKWEPITAGAYFAMKYQQSQGGKKVIAA